MMDNIKNYFKINFFSLEDNKKIVLDTAAHFLSLVYTAKEDLSEISTAVTEAIENSFIHAYNDSVGEISLEIKVDDETVTITVQDHGCGIENIEEALHPAFSTNSELCGIGFSIMESFVDYMDVISENGKGTTVILKKKIVN